MNVGCRVLLALLLLDAGGSSGQSPSFHAESRLVVLHATVTDSRGESVTGLDQRAFAVYENGKRQTITIFRRDDIPISVGLLIDNSGSMRPLRQKVEAAAIAFARASNPDDELFVVNFADKARLDVPMTNDIHELEASIARVDAIGGTALRDAIGIAEQYLNEHARRERRVLLVITDGKDNASATTSERIRQQLAQSQTMIDAIGLFANHEPDRSGPGRRELTELTDRTGGAVYFPASVDQVETVAADVAHQIRKQYTIAYAPTNQALDGSYRTIRVTAAGGEHYTVHTKRGYLAAPTSP
jgi:Ca-activated chloride channel family protein